MKLLQSLVLLDTTRDTLLPDHFFRPPLLRLLLWVSGGRNVSDVDLTPLLNSVVVHLKYSDSLLTPLTDRSRLFVFSYQPLYLKFRSSTFEVQGQRRSRKSSMSHSVNVNGPLVKGTDTLLPLLIDKMDTCPNNTLTLFYPTCISGEHSLIRVTHLIWTGYGNPLSHRITQYSPTEYPGTPGRRTS